MLLKSLEIDDSINRKGCIELVESSSLCSLGYQSYCSNYIFMFYFDTCCRGSERHLYSIDQAQPNGVVEVFS